MTGEKTTTPNMVPFITEEIDIPRLITAKHTENATRARYSFRINPRWIPRSSIECFSFSEVNNVLVYKVDRMQDSKFINTRSVLTESDDSNPQFATCKTRAFHLACQPVTISLV